MAWCMESKINMEWLNISKLNIYRVYLCVDVQVVTYIFECHIMQTTCFFVSLSLMLFFSLSLSCKSCRLLLLHVFECVRLSVILFRMNFQQNWVHNMQNTENLLFQKPKHKQWDFVFFQMLIEIPLTQFYKFFRSFYFEFIKFFRTNTISAH